MPDYSKLSYNLFMLRKRRGFTMQQLGQLSGVSPRTIGRLERQQVGKRITVTHLFRLAKALGCEVSQMLE